MAIHFKFRSSSLLDSVDIEGKPSISVRDLKFKILQKKKLDLAQGFDLLFSDALTGQEYVDENFQIPSGSSVIVKRVPAGTSLTDRTHCDSLENFHIEEIKHLDATPPKKFGMEDLDDFGTELYSIPEATAAGSGIDVDLQTFHQCKTQNNAARYFEIHVEKSNKIGLSAINETIAKGPSTAGTEGKLLEESKMDSEENGKPTRPLALQHMELPSWSKCPICNFVLKVAMMIPCCQQSFCERCILMVLLKSARCPKCNSTKYKAVDLLPNISLRQAIQRICESQLLPGGSHNTLQPEVPDGESCIQMQEVSCKFTILKAEPEKSHSSSSTGIGSNQITGERPHDALLRENLSKEKSDMSLKRPKHCGRSCYMCGSQDHLIRDCPAAYSPYSSKQRGNFQGSVLGYLPTLWGYNPLQAFSPFASLCGNTGMMPSNSGMYSTNCYLAPFYTPATYGGFSSFSFKSCCDGFLNMSAPKLPPWTSGNHACNSDSVDHQIPVKRRKILTDSHSRSCKSRRSASSSRDEFHEKQQPKARHFKLNGDSFLIDRAQENSFSSSNGGRGRPSNHSPDRLGAKVKEMAISPCCYHAEGHKNSQRICRDDFGARSVTGLDHHKIHKEINIKQEFDFKSHHHNQHSHSKYIPEYSRDKNKPIVSVLEHGKWKMERASDEDDWHFSPYDRWKSAP